MVSALLVGLIMIAMFNGFDVANRATADERAHAQADVLAQQDEDRLRGFQISELSALHETRTVTYKEGTGTGTVYTITSKANFVSDATGSESCTAGSATADYIQTTSEVTWPALKARKPVVETGLIAPHLGGSLLVKVIDANGNGVPGMTVKATGPSPSVSTETGTTNTNGCVIFGSVEPGEYKVTTFQTGYVEKDGNEEPPVSERVATVTNGSTTLKEFQFDRAGALAVSFEDPSTKTAVSGDAFLAFNTNMTLPSYKTFGELGTYEPTITSPKKLFPFTGAYTVYAGSCTADDPHAINAAVTDSTAIVTGGSTVEPTPTVTMPPVAIKVWSGKNKASPGFQIEGAQVWIEDTGCKTIRKSVTTSTGALLHPNMPFGKYRLCVTGGPEGGKNGVKKELGKKRKYTYKVGTTFTNNTAAGPSTLATMTDDNGELNEGAAAVYLENGATVNAGAELGEGTTCP